MTLELPLVHAAPMAGGPSTPSLVAAVNAAGGFGWLAAGYRTALDLRDLIIETRARTGAPFGVNVFVPRGPVRDDERAAVERYAERLRADALRLGATMPEPRWDDTDEWADKIALLADVEPVAAVSFAFGCPDADVVERLHRAGSTVLVTVTDLEEARAAAAVGADAVVVQGHEAGGHRSTHDVAKEPNRLDHLALLPMVAEAGLPMVAAGGVTTSGDVRRALAAGACGVSVGTAFMLTDEAGCSPAHRLGLTQPREAVVTRCFSGRWGRGLVNEFIKSHHGTAPASFPQVDQLTKPMRRRAIELADPEWVNLWAGVGIAAARPEPAGDVVARLLTDVG